MTVTGSGVGGNVGGPMVPPEDDARKTATVEIYKEAVGIVKDSIDQSFTLTNPRYSTGFFGRYESTASYPLLDHALESVRVLQGFPPIADDAWKPYYDALFLELPADVQTRLSEELRKNFDERDLAFSALDNLLSGAAKFQAKLAFAGEPLAPDSIINARTEYNQLFPFMAMRGLIEQGGEILQASQDQINEQGANYAHFDTLNYFIGQTGTALEDLEQLLGEARKNPGNPETVDRLNQLAQFSAALQNEFHRASASEELNILGPFLKALSIVTAAWSNSGTGSPTLFIGLSLASTGNGEKNEAALFGPAFGQFLESASSGIQHAFIPEANNGQKKMLELLVCTGFLALIGLTSNALESGSGIYPQQDPGQVKAARHFAFELAVLIAQSSGILQKAIEPLVQSSGGKDKSAENAAQVLSQVGVLLMIATAVMKGSREPGQLIEDNHKYLERGIEIAADIPTEEATSNLPVAIALHQAQVSLDSQDYEGFFNIFYSLLENIGISKEEFNQDLKSIGDAARSITNWAAEKDDQPLTGIINVV